MKKLILLSSLLFFSVVLSGCSKSATTSEQNENLAPPVPEVVSDDKNVEMTKKETKKMNEGDVFKNAPSIQLSDVSGGKGSGKAWVAIKDGKTMHFAVGHNLPQLTNGDFYEGWLVKDPAAGDFFSTGAMVFNENNGEYTLNFETKGDKSDYRLVVITLEPDDGDPAPAGHILEGTFKPEISFEVE